VIVTVLEIVAKIKDLPPDFAQYVHLSKGNTAEVESFTDPLAKPYFVQIELTEKDGSREVTCTCQETEAWKELCDHVVAFYAVAKGIKPDGSIEEAKKDRGKKSKAKKTADKEIEDLEQLLDKLTPGITRMAEASAEMRKVSAEVRKVIMETEEALRKLDAAFVEAMKKIEEK